MTQISVPIDSRLRNPKDSYGYGAYQDSYPRLLMLVAVAALYAKDKNEQLDIYRMHRKNSSAFFTACVDGSIEPFENRVQNLINRQCAKSTRLSLYIGIRRDRKPTHYMSLVKSVETGLWRLRSTKLSAVRSDKRLPRDGIQALWKTDYTPLPEIACELTIYFSRILVEGSGIYEMVSEIEDSPELQHQLSHCTMVCELFSNLRNNIMTVRCSPGKAVFRVRHHDREDSGFVTPYDFEPMQVSPYARRVEKPNVIVWGNALSDSLRVRQIPRSIQPQIRNAQQHSFKTDDREDEFVSDVLLSRLLPFVGITRNDGTVDVFGLSYSPDDRKTIITAYGLGRREASFTMIPSFRAAVNGNGRRVPNYRSVEILKHMLLQLDEMTGEQRYWLMRLFRWLGVQSNLDAFVTMFSFWCHPLSDEDIGILRRYLES
ncbi:MAG: hypothetical protein ABFD49_04790 [Armatimonadota bacterium]